MVILGRIFGLVDGLVSSLAGIALWVMTLVLFIGSLARYFADFAFVGGAELARYLMVWLTFLGSYLLVRVQRHISVDLLSKAVGVRAKRALDIAISIAGALLLGYIAWLGWNLTSLIFNTGQMMSSLPIQRGWIYLSVPVGCGLMSLAYVFQLLVLIFGGDLPKAEDFGLTPEVPEALPGDGEHKE